MSANTKPHIKYDRKCAWWVCHDNYYIWGYGSSPYDAFVDWKCKEQQRTRLSRRGIRNLKDCKRWFKAGCKTLRSYIGHRQIVGYDPLTDELVLRG